MHPDDYDVVSNLAKCKSLQEAYKFYPFVIASQGGQTQQVVALLLGLQFSCQNVKPLLKKKRVPQDTIYALIHCKLLFTSIAKSYTHKCQCQKDLHFYGNIFNH